MGGGGWAPFALSPALSLPPVAGSGYGPPKPNRAFLLNDVLDGAGGKGFPSPEAVLYRPGGPQPPRAQRRPAWH